MALLGAGLLSGCNAPAVPAGDSPRALEQLQEQLNAQVRQQLAQIPTPMKSQYLAVRSLESWENPYLTVQQSMLTLHVMLADANTSGLGEGGLLRPRGARRQDLTVRVGELTAALNAVPASAWPYGRIVAVEEAHNTPKRDEAEVRRSVETVMRSLNDLGVVAYEWPDSGTGTR